MWRKVQTRKFDKNFLSQKIEKRQFGRKSLQKIHNFLKGTGFFGKNQNPGIGNFFLLKVAKKIPRDAQKVATTAFA